MGWIAYKRDGTFLEEGKGYARPVEAGQNNELMLIGEIDHGHSVAVNLDTGQIALDWTAIGYQNGTFELQEPKVVFFICDGENRVGEFKHNNPIFESWYSCGQPEVTLPWYNCRQTVKDEKDNEVACDLGSWNPGNCERGHKRLKGERTIPCDSDEQGNRSGHTDPEIPCARGHKRLSVLHGDGTPVAVKTDVLTPLIWRPIWYIHHSFPGGSTKVVGAQTTLPKEMGSKNVKKLVSIFEDMTIGID